MTRLPPGHPAGRTPLTDRVTAYVRSRAVLRAALVLTLVDHLAAIVIVAIGHVDAGLAGFLVLLSLLTWFFAVVLPVLNREVRAGLGAEARSYWGEVVETFARVVLALQTLLYTAALVWLIAAS